METILKDNQGHKLFIRPEVGRPGTNGFINLQILPEGLSGIQIIAKELLEAIKAAAAVAKS